MNVNVHEPVLRDGFWLTRQHWQHYDRLNAHPALHGMLVVVQGGRSFAPDSGTTHRLLGAVDYRRWNLSIDQAEVVVIEGRDLCGATHERFTWQGFEPHFHECLLGDDIPGLMDIVAIAQCITYKAGGDGVAGTTGDIRPYRPNPIRDYVYLEDPDMTPEEHKELMRIGRRLDSFAAGELKRDEADRIRERERFEALTDMMAKEADSLTTIINHTSDASTKQQLRKVKERILLKLEKDPDVPAVNKPDPGQMP